MSYRPLVTVHLWSGLRGLADGRETVEVRAAPVGQMLDALVAEIPALAE
ncbi:MAG: MoaD/ThiS family protein, partial [Boseongicola sp. SB0676_bin_33]|nr:MoaD/ThiS family protein [Boseongicola sp. SB0676_bin_33]